MARWRTANVKHVANAFLALSTQEEILLFLRDLLSDKELIDISKRLQAAKLLSNGHTYRDVAKKTGLSTTTVTRVAHSVFGKTGGIDHVLSLLDS